MPEQVVITGGGGDLAAALRQAFTQSGALVAAPTRAELDVSSTAAVDAWFAAHAVPDLLIVNAARAESQLLRHATAAAWDRQMQVNLYGALRCIRAVTRRLIEASQPGHCILISSQAAHRPEPGQAIYGTSKAALIGLTSALARELGPSQIRVNAVLPGFLETRMTGPLSEKHRERIRDQHCLGRFNTPQTTAEFLVFLHLHLPHTSGQILQLDSRPE